MSDAMSIALSGLQAAMTQADVAASNIANMRSTGALAGGPGAKAVYSPVRVEQSALGVGAGTEARVRPVLPAYVPSFEPDAGFADANGLVAAPNVDPLEEMVGLEEAAFAFRANLMVASRPRPKWCGASMRM